MSRVAVVGTGAIGALAAAALQNAGRHEVLLCARRPRRPPTVSFDGDGDGDGGGGGGGGGAVEVTGPVLVEPDRAPVGVDAVVLAVKAHQSAGAFSWLRALRAARTPVLVLQNGVEHRERLAGEVPAGQVVPGIVWCTVEEVAEGDVRVRPGDRRIEVPEGEVGQQMMALFAGSFLDLRALADFHTAAWDKLVHNAVVAVEPLTGRRAEVFADRGIAGLAAALARECVAVARADGARLPADFAASVVARLCAQPPDQGTSILYDRLAGRPLEWDARNGVIVRAGVRHGVPTPISDVLVPLLAASSVETVEPHS